ncbi:MAG TPA: hypothetical protein P5328_02600 [Candidatus Paceibacterota bacterium]|nr:hypothetical protein [Candidatus Paceibacterota bacterium]HRZ34333.1 hypothetical protein [Candidatus Paceibacterota bacterium]
MPDLIITRSPFFVVNPDRITGHVVSATGEKSRKFYTKWQAKQYVYSMRDVEFDDAEVKVLIEMIDNSSLINSDTHVEQTTDRMAEFEAKMSSGCRPSV